MAKTVDFIFDFGSPNAYLSRFVLRDIAARTGATINYLPCLLGGIFKATGNQAPMIAFGQIKGKMAYEMLETQRFIAKHSLSKFRMNSHFPINTLILMRGAIAAEQDGRLAEYIDAGLAAMWEDDRKMDDAEVYAEAMTAAGFDGVDLLTRTQEGDVKAKLMANTEAAVTRGAFGIPTFFVGSEMFFGKERLAQVEDVLAE
jgi:2-hydroxychromene-2-carboxylate isomerase